MESGRSSPLILVPPDLGDDVQDGEEEGEDRGADGSRDDCCFDRDPTAAQEQNPTREHLAPSDDPADRREREEFGHD